MWLFNEEKYIKVLCSMKEADDMVVCSMKKASGVVVYSLTIADGTDCQTVLL